MSERITRKIDRHTLPDPAGRPPERDPWREFREVERIDLDLQFHFTHSLGKVSRFFLELEHQRLMAARCPHCGKVWMPPRALCGDDMTITEWLELPGHGTLEAATRSAHALTGKDAAPRLLGYVRLAGADTLLLQQVRHLDDPGTLEAGLPVKAVWADGRVGHPMEAFWFEPA